MSSTGLRTEETRTQRLRRLLVESPPTICPERAEIYTRVYRETEGEPMVIRRAKALASVLREMTIFILDDELIVGNQGSTPRSAPIFPETETAYVGEELDTFETRRQDRFKVPQGTKERIRNILPYWKNKTVKDYVFARLPVDTRKLLELECKVLHPEIHILGGIGHFVPGYHRVLEVGFEGIKQFAMEKLGSLDEADPGCIERRWFYEAVIVVCEGVIDFAKRYSDLAIAMADTEQSEKRKDELLRIAKVCTRVPRLSATSFYEAIQSIWFQHLIIQIESNGLGVSPGRLDQILYPYYVRDRESGVLTKDEAQELIDNFWLKTEQIKRVYDYDCARYFAGYSTELNCCIGGQTPEGLDATNELSYMFLDAERRIGLAHPNVTVRIHERTPSNFLLTVLEVIRLGRGKPQLANDEAVIPAMLNRGIPLTEARDYAFIGCVEPGVPGKEYSWANAAMFDVAKCLELALNDGKCRLSGQQIGPRTGDPRAFKEFSEVVEAFKKQVEYFVRQMIVCLNTVDLCHQELMPVPYASILIDDCLEKGMDASKGGARWNLTGPQGVGVVDVADSLAALKMLVFETREFQMQEIIDALDHNFEGYERMRQRLIHGAPKYGNDDDYVDLLAREVGRIYCREVEEYRNPRGGYYQPGLYPVSAHVPLGMCVGALPSGRLACTPLGDGLSPTHGSDRKGPTAVVKSVAKIDHMLASNGTLLNQKVHPNTVKTARDLEKWASLIRVYFRLKGNHIQYNVVTAETLKDAQKHPEKYRDLIVRVAGYSACFVDLDEAVQNDIIERTEHVLD